MNTASLKTSRINEESNILSLRTTAISIITSTVFAYRQFFQAKQQLEIAENSLKRAKDLLAVNEELIKAGRMAKVEIVQTKADVANREFSLVQSQNSLDAARLALLQVLDIDKYTLVDPVEEVKIESMELDNDRLLDVAFKMRTDYLQSLLSLRTAEIDLIVAKNNRLWDLNLDGSYGVSATNENRLSDAIKESLDNDRSNWGLGLSLDIPFGDLSRKQRYLSARTSLEKQELSLEELEDNIEIEVQDAIRDVRMKLRQVELARHARTLTEQKLVIEEEKLRVGRSTNFQLVTFQNDLINAENSELNAIIDYLNALTGLDQTLGTTLETWQIKVED